MFIIVENLKPLNKKILFLTLRVFSAAGGIERVCRVAGKALYELNTGPNASFSVYSMYGKTTDANPKYFPAENFYGFAVNKARYVYASFKKGIRSDIVILSHINLLVVGALIKIFSPKTKLILIAHGIEVWKSLPGWKKNMLKKFDLILCVSNFTKDKMIALNKLSSNQFTVVNNCLDPFLPPPINESKDEGLIKKYGLSKNDIVLLTLSRLSVTEKYKGYDEVIIVMHQLSAEYLNLRYLLVGKYDEEEKYRIDKLIEENCLKGSVVFAGYIPDEELAAHYNLADIFIMPSKKEGFGIAFIEAMHYGKPVIAGNKDGSVDALLNGKIGLLVNPDSEEEIGIAIKKIISNKRQYLPDHNLLMEHFSYEVYKNNIKKTIESLY
jgi:phosphatidyl-myo-inositol dimannoside synthase